jgi:hypothetical protein
MLYLGKTMAEISGRDLWKCMFPKGKAKLDGMEQEQEEI